MSIEAKIATLKSILALDAELLALETELRAERATLQKKAERARELAERASYLQGSVTEMEKTRSELLGELRQMTQQVDKAREKMARVRTEREANAVQRELEELRRIQRERENEIQKLVGLADEARAELEKLGEQGAAPQDPEEGNPEARVAELEALIADKQGARGEVASSFDKQLLRRYDAVRAKRGSGAAAVIQGNCSACHIALPPMVYQQMMQRKELSTCPSCLRLLYWEAPSVEGSSEG